VAPVRRGRVDLAGSAGIALALFLASACAEPHTRPSAAEARPAPTASAPAPATTAAEATAHGEIPAPSAPNGSAAPVAAPNAPRLWSVGHISWIRPRPEVKEGDYSGYVRTGSSVALESTERVPGPGCSRGFYRVAPRGFVCADRTVTETPPDRFRRAADATRGGAGPFPYRYAFSNGAPMYNRVPTEAEQQRFERAYGPRGAHPKLPKGLRTHEELATPDPIDASDPVPDFLANGGSAKESPYDLVERTLPHGSMLSYTRAFQAEGRTWLLSSDHTIVPADRVWPFRPSAFHGVDLAAGEATLPLAWIRERARPAFFEQGGALESAGESFPVRSWVGLTGREQKVGDRTFLETKRTRSDGGSLWLLASDATVVANEPARPFGVQPGQKWVVVRLTQGTLVAYDDLTPVFSTLVSPGAGGVPVSGRDAVKDSTTPLGTYLLTFKDRAATMSPDKGEERTFWIQDVPHTQYFNPPFALHGAFWHERFGEYVSAGCVNLSPLDAEKLFAWTDPQVPVDWQGAAGAGAKENGLATAVVIRR
jgi:hypothetical protein